MMGKRRIGVVITVLLTAFIAGCGGGQKADMNIFMMHEFHIPSEQVDKLEQELNEKLNGEYTIDVMASPLYNAQKIVLEYVGAENAIIILPYDDIQAYSTNGGHYPLDDFFDKSQYEEGILEGTYIEKIEAEDKKTEYLDHVGEYLFALPTTKLPLLEKYGLVEEKWYAAIPSNNPDLDRSVQLMKMLASQP